jgi:hypothetical protein
MIYCGWLQSPRPALSAKNVLNVPQHASGHFPPAALASSFSLDLVTTLILLECLNKPRRSKAMRLVYEIVRLPSRLLYQGYQ